jgi:NAD(P)-dependent dehydrogenase (short-subunit alcohol dehydrogenase family)
LYDLKGKVVLVTGAGGELGIGRAIATRLASEGADIIANDVTDNPYSDHETKWRGISSLVEEIETLGRQAVAEVADVSNYGQVQEMVNRGVERFGHIDILVNNAGSRPGKDRVLVVDLEEEAWDTVQRVNAKGTFICSQVIARQMIKQGTGGKIINISSGAGKRGRAKFAAYCASKFAVIGFTEALSQELAQYKINVNAICPGLVDTERAGYIARALTPKGESSVEFHAQMIQERGDAIPLGRVADGPDVANTAAFLASSESDYLTGLSIPVAGGFLY